MAPMNYTKGGKFFTNCGEMCCDPSVVEFELLSETSTSGNPTANFSFEVCGIPHGSIMCEEVVVGFVGETEDWRSPREANQSMVIKPGTIVLDEMGKGVWGPEVIELPSRNICGNIIATIVV